MDRSGLMLAAVAVVAAGAWLALRKQAQAMAFEQNTDAAGWNGILPGGWADLAPEWAGGEPDQNTGLIEDIFVTLNPSNYVPANVAPDVAASNVRAFLDMIAYAEGTAGRGDDGYDILFGYGTFDSYADHPRVYIPYGDTTTSAAGRYQILARTWDGLRGKLGLSDFTPASQDAAAIELIRERGALSDVQAGRVERAISKVAKVWASLPGAGYKQPERKIQTLIAAYEAAGGNRA